MSANTVAPGGESAIIVPISVPKAVHRLRERMDPSAAVGVPAHVTLLYPFMPVDSLDVEVRIKLRRILESEPSFKVRFSEVQRFPNVVYLPPDPPDPFRRLTAALAAEFPDYPPYGGVYETVIPHMTIAQDVADDFYAAAEHALPTELPIQDIVREAWLIGHMPEQPWHTLWRLPFGEAQRPEATRA